MTTPYYRPSGRYASDFRSRSVATTVAMLAAAWMYAVSAKYFHPLVHGAVLLTFSAMLIGSVIYLCHKSQVRSPVLMVGVTLAMTVIAWYFQWVVWAALVDPQRATRGYWSSLMHFLEHPRAVLAVVTSLRGDIFGAISTAGEFILFVIIPTWTALTHARYPFCETTMASPSDETLPRRFGAIANADRKRFIAALEAAPDQFMTVLPAYTQGAPQFTCLHLFLCPGGKQAWLSFFDVSEKFVEGESILTSKEFVEYLEVSAATGAQTRIDCSPGGVAPVAVTQPLDDEDEVDEVEDEVEDELADRARSGVDAKLKPALRAMDADDFDETLALARPYTYAVKEQVRADANRMCAISCSRLGQWSAAAGYWEALFGDEATGHNALQVATSKVMAGELAEGEEWIEKTKTVNQQTADISPILIHTNFVSALKNSGYLRAALPYLEWVKQMYERAHKTDPTYLTLRGLPFFESFLDQSAPIVDASLDRAQAHAWYASMLPHLDQSGQDAIHAWLERRAGR